MSRAISRMRHKHRVNGGVYDEGVVLGDTSSADTANLITSLLAEAATKGVGQYEASKAGNSQQAKDAAQAQSDAAAAQKSAVLAAADATGEADPNGPLHVKAKQMATAAQVATTKAQYLASLVPGAAPMAPAAPAAGPKGKGGGGSSLLTVKNIAIAGLVGVGGYLIYKKVKG